LELESGLAKEGQKKLKECREMYNDSEVKQQQQQNAVSSQLDLYATDESDGGSDDDDALENGIDAHIAVPSQEVVAQVLLQKKKEALLSRFA
jgi:hypothetical protein